MPFVPLPGAILRDKTTGRVWHLDVGRDWIVGRWQESDVMLADHSVARRHCRIDFGEQKWSIVDFRGANGTWVNGNRVDRLDLASGDSVAVGRSVFAFEAGATPPRPQPPRAIDDMEAAARSLDALDAATSLHGYVLEAIAGRRDPFAAMRSLASLREVADESLIASAREAAIASVRDASEIGLRVTAVRLLGVLAPDDGHARRALDMTKRDRALEVRQAAMEALGLDRDRRR